MEIGASLSLMSFVGALDVRYIIRSLRGALTQDRPMRQLDFDIDPNTGFFPSKPLPRLPHRFSVWEHAMTDAQGKVSLADDNSQQALAKREAGERWRESVRSVSAFSGACLILFVSHPIRNMTIPTAKRRTICSEVPGRILP